jgi:hypothetical protein
MWRLSRKSGLHPKCFILYGLQKVGQQVAAGGFGDIWKGVVYGQSVCVKAMRLFQAADVQALLKVYFSILSKPISLLTIIRNSAEKPPFGANFVTQICCLSLGYTIWTPGSV